MSWYQHQNEPAFQQQQDHKLGPICNKLQSHKSSFQAWKCVSFGCSLLAVVLLSSKWYEVSTDLHLLQGIGQLLAQQQAAGANGSALSWPPVPLDQLLPPLNGTTLDDPTSSSSSAAELLGMESLENNGTMLMSHLHISLSRELNANQLLRREVDAFIAEFRTAKSTLSLSSLLVLVYVVSWILMTLAINDARISNDISLRNILLLSVFGAIDIAASVGFVMVRLIMYSVKNNSFANDILGSSALRDAPVRLTADQLTAFTALRLIGMRSCSAYVDIYVSVVVALLTVLRLYAILRALTYYRRLRRLSDSRSQRRSLEHLLQAGPALKRSQQQQQQQQQQQVWSTPSPLAYQLAGGQPPTQPQHAHPGPIFPSHLAGQYLSGEHQQLRGNLLSVGSLKPASGTSKRNQLVVMQKQARGQPERKSLLVQVANQQAQQQHLSRQRATVTGSHQPKPASRQLVVVNGRAHRLLLQPTAEEETAPKGRKAGEREAARLLTEGNLLPEGVSFRRLESPSSSEHEPAGSPDNQAPLDELEEPENDDNETLPIELQPTARLRAANPTRAAATLGRTSSAGASGAGAACYTLLTAKQLERLGRQLGAKAAGSTRYRATAGGPTKRRAAAGELQRAQPLGASLRHSGGSHALTASPEPEASDSEAGSHASSDAGRQPRGQEELLAGADQKLFELSTQVGVEGSDSQQQLLLGKYYYA